MIANLVRIIVAESRRRWDDYLRPRSIWLVVEKSCLHRSIWKSRKKQSETWRLPCLFDTASTCALATTLTHDHLPFSFSYCRVADQICDMVTLPAFTLFFHWHAWVAERISCFSYLGSCGRCVIFVPDWNFILHENFKEQSTVTEYAAREAAYYTCN